MVTQWGLQMRRGVLHISLIYYASVFWISSSPRSLPLSLWEQQTEMARFARSNGPDVHQNSVHMMI